MFEKDSAIKVFYIGTSKIMGLLFCLVITALYCTQVVAADCSSVDITVASQAEVETFQTTYGGATPPCDIITGSLTVSGVDIDDLSPLSTLTSVGGHFFIENNAVLTNLTGLSSLVSVGNQFIIRENPLLTNLDGLSALIEVKDILLNKNSELTNLDGLLALTGMDGSLSITQSTSLTNLNGLSSLTSLGGYLIISSNPLLTNLDGLSALTSVGISGFSQGVDISANPALTNLDGLSALISVEGEVVIWDNDLLTNLDGLSGLTEVGSGLRVRLNDELADLDGLAALISVGGWVFVEENPQLASCSALTTVLDDVDDGAPGPGPGEAGIPDVGGDVVIGGNLFGCNSLNEILGPIFTDGFERSLDFDGSLYEDLEYGFSLVVPSDRTELEWAVVQPNIIKNTEFLSPNGAPAISISIYENPQLIPIVEWYEAVLSDKEFTYPDSGDRNERSVLVDSVESLQLESHLMGVTMIRTYIPHGDVVLGISTWMPDDLPVPDIYFAVLSKLLVN